MGNVIQGIVNAAGVLWQGIVVAVKIIDYPERKAYAILKTNTLIKDFFKPQEELFGIANAILKENYKVFGGALAPEKAYLNKLFHIGVYILKKEYSPFFPKSYPIVTPTTPTTFVQNELQTLPTGDYIIANGAGNYNGYYNGQWLLAPTLPNNNLANPKTSQPSYYSNGVNNLGYTGFDNLGNEKNYYFPVAACGQPYSASSSSQYQLTGISEPQSMMPTWRVVNTGQLTEYTFPEPLGQTGVGGKSNTYYFYKYNIYFNNFSFAPGITINLPNSSLSYSLSVNGELPLASSFVDSTKYPRLYCPNPNAPNSLADNAIVAIQDISSAKQDQIGFEWHILPLPVNSGTVSALSDPCITGCYLISSALLTQLMGQALNSMSWGSTDIVQEINDIIFGVSHTSGDSLGTGSGQAIFTIGSQTDPSMTIYQGLSGPDSTGTVSINPGPVNLVSQNDYSKTVAVPMTFNSNFNQTSNGTNNLTTPDAYMNTIWYFMPFQSINPPGSTNPWYWNASASYSSI